MRGALHVSAIRVANVSSCEIQDLTPIYSEDLVKQLAQYEPLRVVFRDSGFVSDAVKINVEHIFKQMSPSTEVKSI